MSELVSAIITTYKRKPEMVVRATKSILNQTYKNIEIIVVDDSPENYEYRDDVKDAVTRLDTSILYICHEKNMGACAARNTGIKASKGKFVAFLDDDDEWLPEKIKKQLTLFDNEETALVYVNSYIISSKGKEIRKSASYKGKVYGPLLIENFIGSTSFVICRKSALEDVGYFDEEMEASQDLELWLRIAMKYCVDYVDEPLVNYYVHDGEQITKNPKKKVNGFTRLIGLNIEYLKKHRKVYSISILNIVPYLCKYNKRQAIKLLIKGIWLYPFNFYYIAKALYAFVK